MKNNKGDNIYIHRDLSWLSFNERVLKEASDTENPLLERMKFISIAANNLDEFFMVRVAGIKKIIDSGYNQKDQFGYYPDELYKEILDLVRKQVKMMYSFFEEIKKDLEKNKIFILDFNQLNNKQRNYVEIFFETTLFPIITPIAIDPGHPFPALLSKTPSLAFLLKKEDNFFLALIIIPKSIPRFYKIPSERGEICFISIDEIIRNKKEVFFEGYTVLDSFFFKIIKDSEINFFEDYSSDVLKIIEEEIKKRPRAKVVGLQIEKGEHSILIDNLLQKIQFPKDEIVFLEKSLDLSSLSDISSQVTLKDISFKNFVPAKLEYDNIFDKIKDGDFILHLPYQSFYPTIDLIKTAASDPEVLAIKMTLYRTSEDSPIIKYLVEAAKNKKQVTVLVELKARFDEERNIEWTKELERAGCYVIYGVSNLKVHAKITLIVRREDGRIRRYVHLSTGNYNEKTAKIYTDIGYFTSNEDFGRDIAEIFNMITGYSLPKDYNKVVVSPIGIRNYLFELIDQEIEFQKKYKNGLILAKMNSLEDTKIINKLYEASNYGVKIKLIVRGICCLIPGIKGLSENIEVKSVVGRFLEHSRIFIFNNNFSKRVFLSSADWMTRNFDRRIEVMFEIVRQDIASHLVEIFEKYWLDNRKSYFLLSDGKYIKRLNDSEKAFNAQEFFINYYGK